MSFGDHTWDGGPYVIGVPNSDNTLCWQLDYPAEDYAEGLVDNYAYYRNDPQYGEANAEIVFEIRDRYVEATDMLKLLSLVRLKVLDI